MSRGSRNESKRLRAEQWAELIKEQAESGQSIAGFCRSQGIQENRFHYWRKRLSEPEAGFVQVKVSANGGMKWCEIALTNGRILRVPPDCSVADVKNVLMAAETA